MKVAWGRQALADIEAIQEFIAIDSPRMAYRVAGEILDRTEEALSVAPRAGRLGRVLGTRELVLPDMSYIVVYRVHDQVEILGVVHSAQQWPTQFD